MRRGSLDRAEGKREVSVLRLPFSKLLDAMRLTLRLSAAFQRVMVVKHVQQLEFLEEAEMLLLLADSVSHSLYLSLEAGTKL